MPNLLLIADDPLARVGLATMLTTETELTISGQSDSHDVLADCELYQPDMVLWDLGWEVSMPPPQLGEVAEQLPLILLAPEEAPLSEIWGQRPHALLPRDVNASQLLATYEAVLHGLIVLAPVFIEALSPAPLPQLNPTEYEPLTPRELEVLQLLSEGLANKTISRRLNISDHTVKFHVNAILSKLQAQSRTEAVVRAARLGLILL